jgi:hypothetical protein
MDITTLKMLVLIGFALCFVVSVVSITSFLKRDVHDPHDVLLDAAEQPPV